jgi:hypothetical protein
MESVTQFITQKLRLKVNETKSAVARPQEREFLGFSFSVGPEVKRVIAPKALAARGATRFWTWPEKENCLTMRHVFGQAKAGAAGGNLG